MVVGMAIGSGTGWVLVFSGMINDAVHLRLRVYTDILRESLEHERVALAVYKELLAEVAGKSVLLEEYARRLIAAEEVHQGNVDKMLRRPGDVGTYSG